MAERRNYRLHVVLAAVIAAVVAAAAEATDVLEVWRSLCVWLGVP